MLLLAPCPAHLPTCVLDKFPSWMCSKSPGLADTVPSPIPGPSDFPVFSVEVKCTEVGGSLGGTLVRNLSADAEDSRDAGLIPGLERFPGVGNDNLFQHSCLKNPWIVEPGVLEYCNQGVGWDAFLSGGLSAKVSTSQVTQNVGQISSWL